AILLSGCLFAFMHGSILGLPAHLLLGLVLGVLAVYTGSIWAPMLYHLCHNGLSMLIAYQVARFSPQAAEEEAVALTWGEAAQLLPAMLLLFALLALFLRFALRARHLKAYVDCRPRTGTFSVWIWTAICLLLAAMAAAYGMDGLAMMIEGGTIV
ncbi:MAG: CPBP family glutamic-type intramembrane protease, partial [Clostridia bacterium]